VINCGSLLGATLVSHAGQPTDRGGNSIASARPQYGADAALTACHYLQTASQYHAEGALFTIALLMWHELATAS
jgi:hypothetical protein